MILGLMALLIALQAPDIDGKAVGQIMTSVLTDSVPGVPRILSSLAGRPVVIDVVGSSESFERVARRRLTVDSAAWLPTRQFSKATRTELLDCPPGTDRVTARCRVPGDTVWIHVDDVSPGNNGELLVRVQVLWTARLPKGNSSLHGFTTTRAVRRGPSGWRMERVVMTAVG